jgi:four helix bundle protein
MALPALIALLLRYRNPGKEVVMAKRYRFRFKTMDVYQAAVGHFAWTVKMVGRLPRGPFAIPNQMVGASLSILGNVAEANGREKQPGEVEQHYRYAQGSTFESAGYLDALYALEVIDDDEYNAQEEHLAGIAAMLTRLMQSHRRRRPPEEPGPQARAPKSRASGVPKPAPAGVEKPASAGVEKPAPAGVEKPAPAGVEKPASAGVASERVP